MIPDKVLYTDGHDVMVTDSVFQVKKTAYLLNGITKHGLLTVQPHRLPGILLLLAGVILAGMGFLRLIPASTISDMPFNGTFVSANTVAIVVGSLLVLIGIVVIGMLRERYAVRISTAEGEKNVIVSSRKEYVSQIIAALNQAFNFGPKKPRGFQTYSGTKG